MKNVFDIAEARGRRTTELDSVKQQLRRAFRNTAHQAEQARLAIESGDITRAVRILKTLELSGELAARVVEDG